MFLGIIDSWTGRLIGYAIAKGGKPMGSPPLSSFISLVLFHKFRDLDSDACRYIVRVWQDIHVVLHDVRPILLGAEESDGTQVQNLLSILLE